MISHIAGTLESIDGLEAVLRLEGGVAYQVLLPAYLAERLTGQRSRPAAFHTMQYLEGQGQGSWFVPRLLGFATREERRFFELMTTVEGLGNRRVLRALAREPADIAAAIARGDAAWLTQLPEIGKKTAEKVVLELRGKVEAFVSPAERVALDTASQVKPATDGPPGEAIAALIALGETRADAERMVHAAVSRNGRLGTADQIVAAAYGGR